MELSYLAMKRFSAIALALLLVVAFSLPVSTLAAEESGIKPGSFFYGFVTTFEKINLFFTFSPEKKAEKALKYAEKRLAEAEAVAGDENSEAVKTAISGYEKNIALAAQASKKVKDETKAENLFNLIAENTSKHQEVLADVLTKVPEEAKEAITKAIEVSRKGQEEALQKIAELKHEVAELKQEIAELKKQQGAEPAPSQDINAPSQPTSIKELKKEIEELKKQAAEKEEREKQTPIPTPTPTPSQTQTQTSEPPNIKPTVQPPSNTTNAEPAPTTQTQTLTTIEISSVNITPSLSSAQIVWQTNVPTNSKIFLSGGSLSSKVYGSESGLSTRHIVNATGLTSGTTYSYEIEAIIDNQVVKKEGSFSTKPDELAILLQADKTSVPLTGWNSVKITAQFTKNGKLVPVDISFSAPDDSKTYKVIQNWPACGNLPFLIQLSGTTGGGCSSDAKVDFQYQPKSLGTHTISVSANGVTKSIDIKVLEYVKIDPTIRDVVNSNPVFEINSTEEKSIGSFKFSQSDEPIKFETYDYKYESDIQEKGFLRIIQAGEGYQLRAIPKTNTYALAPGIHTVKITEIKVVGISSGSYRYVSGLPVTFTFEIKDIPNPEIIPVKTTHTYTGGRHPGVIGLFQIKMRPNSSIKLLCDNIRMINGGDSYSAYIYKETASGRLPQCPTSWFGGESNIGDVSTDSNGVSTLQYSLWIQDLTPPSNKMEFRIEGMKVKDMTTGIVRDVLSPPIFNLEIVN